LDALPYHIAPEATSAAQDTAAVLLEDSDQRKSRSQPLIVTELRAKEPPVTNEVPSALETAIELLCNFQLKWKMTTEMQLYIQNRPK
jgi:hypothetical protein